MSFSKKRINGPLGKLQKKSDKLKSEVDKIILQIASLEDPKQGNELEKLADALIDSKVQASNLLLSATSLVKNDEPELINNFERRKTDEVKRLQLLQKRTDSELQKIRDDQNKLNENQTRTEIKDVESVDDEDSEYFSDDVETDDVTSNEAEIDIIQKEDTDEENADLYVVTSLWAGQQKGDLSLKKDEVIDVLQKNKDGWWMAQNNEGETGLVPSNFLTKYNDNATNTPSDVTETNEEICETTDDVTGEDDVNSERSAQVVVVPKKIKDSANNNNKEKTGKWNEIKEALDINENNKPMEVGEILSALGAVPSGFRVSELHKLEREFDLKSTLVANIDNNATIFYSNLPIDPLNKKLLSDTNRFLRSLQIIECRNIPPLGSAVEVLSRQIRACVFDNGKVLSNIWKLNLDHVPIKQKHWKFQPNNQSAFDNLLVVRTTEVTRKRIGILFELSVSYIRNSTRQQGQLSCGWTFLPLYDDNRLIIENRAYKLPLNGGTIYENGIPLDRNRKSIKPKAGFQSMLASRVRDAFLMVRVGVPHRKFRKFVDYLPSSIVTSLNNAHLLAFHRQRLFDVVVGNASSSDDVTIRPCPHISAFLRICNHCDVMDAVRGWWKAELVKLSKSQRREEGVRMRLWKEAVMKIAFPLCEMKVFNRMESQSESFDRQKRAEVISKLQEGNPLSLLMSANQEFAPFDAVDHSAYDIINP